MIQIIKIEDAKDKWNVLSQFKQQETNFLVSDTKSKLALENFLFQKESSLAGHSVMRMTEFYTEIFQWTHPQWQVVSKHFLGELFTSFAFQHSSPWVKRMNSYETFFNYLDQFLPVLCHQQGSELIKDWLQKNKTSASLRWGCWYELCEEFFKYIKQKKIFYESGIKGLLIDQVSVLKENSFVSSCIVVDSGLSFDFCDKSILQDLSRNRDVYLLTPFSQKSDFLEQEDCYSFLEKEISQEDITIKKRASQNKTQYLSSKSCTSLEEVKKAVSQIRLWLDSGVKKTDIALVAPRIEDYWFCLKPYLERENIKVQKNFVVSFQSFPEVIHWISCLKSHLGLGKFFDLESVSFYKNPRIAFSKFKSLYYHLPEKKQTNILKEKKIKDSQQEISGYEFVEWALSLWPMEGREDILSDILQNFQEGTLNFKLKAEQWLRYLISSIFSQGERELQKENANGITCLSLNALGSVKSSHIFFLGLDEEALSSHSSTGLTQQDRSDLVSELGFPIPFFYSDENEKYLFWFLQSSFLKEVVLSFSNIDFSGETKTASAFWFWFKKTYCKENDLKDIKNVWDSQKNQNDIHSVLQIANYKKEDIKALEDSFKKNKFYKNPNPIELSHNSLNNYIKCPFIYAASKIFHTEKQQEVKRDISPLHLGSWAHKLLESFNSDDIEFSKEKIEEIRPKKLEEYLSHEEDWDIIKYKLEIIYKQILQKEREWRKEFPDLKIKTTELNLKDHVFWNKEKNCLDEEGTVSITGSIDRVDYNSQSKEYIAFDYKGSDSQLRNLKSWENNKSFQLLLYAYVLEKGLIKGFEAAPVKALVYYIYKKIGFKGYVEKTSEYTTMFKPGMSFMREELDKKFQWMNELIEGVVLSIENGDFSPQPQNKKICEECERRTWCRATHLI